MGASFRDLLVWQRAIELSVATYKLTSGFSDAERFGLISQLRRASVSVASNIAEGYGKASRGEYVQFLGHARGSICEVQTQFEIAKRLGYGNEKALAAAESLSFEVGRMLVTIIQKLEHTGARSSSRRAATIWAVWAGTS